MISQSLAVYHVRAAHRCYLMVTARIVHDAPSAELPGSDILHSIYLGGSEP